MQTAEGHPPVADAECEERAGGTLVLGMGNTLVSDDGAGIVIARRVKNCYRCNTTGYHVDIIETCESGPALMLLLNGYDAAVIIDSIKTAGGVPGDIHILDLDSMSETRNTVSPHSMNLFTAVELGRRLGLKMPVRLHIVAVEAEDTVTVREQLTDAVEKAMPEAVKAVLKLIDKQNPLEG